MEKILAPEWVYFLLFAVLHNAETVSATRSASAFRKATVLEDPFTEASEEDDNRILRVESA